MDAAVGLDGGQQSVDGLPQPDAVPVRQKMLQERVPGAFEEPFEGLRVGGVPGFRASGLRHVEFLEQHRLQLLRGTEVHFVPQHVPRRLLSGHDGGVELGPQSVQDIPVHGDANALAVRQGPLQRKFHISQELRRGLGFEFGPQHPGQFRDRPGIQHGRPCRGPFVHLEQGFLGLGGHLHHQLAVQVPLHQGGQFLPPDVGPQQIGRQGHVQDHPTQLPAPGPDRQQRAFCVVDHLGAFHVGQPVRHRFVVGGGQFSGIDERLRPLGGRQAEAPQITRPGSPDADERESHLSLGVLLQPGRHLTGFQGPSGDGEHLPGLVLFVPVVPVQLGKPFLQGTELKGGEQLGDGLPVPVAAFGLLEPQGQFQVPQQPVQAPVAPHFVEMVSQRLARLARNLLGAFDDVRQAVVGVDPLGRGLGPDAGNPGQVVAGLPHQRRQLRVALRRY